MFREVYLVFIISVFFPLSVPPCSRESDKSQASSAGEKFAIELYNDLNLNVVHNVRP